MVKTQKSSPLLVILIASLSVFVTVMDVTIVNNSLPDMKKVLNASTASMQWIVDMYTIMYAGAMLSMGSLVDRFGAKRTFQLGLIVFGLSSLACGLAQDINFLIISRIFQGLGAAAITPASLSLIRHEIQDKHERNQAIAIWAAGGSIALSAGAVLGGILTQLVSWRFIFLVNLPFTIIAVALLFLVQNSPQKIKPFDIWGQIIFLTASILIVESIISIGSAKYLYSIIIAVIAILLYKIFIRYEAKIEHPIFPPTVLKLPAFIGTAIPGALLSFATFGLLFILGTYFQTEYHYSAITSGLLFLPMTITVGLANLIFAKLSKKYSPKNIIIFGLILESITFIILAYTVYTRNITLLVIASIFLGFGAGLPPPGLNTTILNHTESHISGVTSAALNTTRQIGSAIGVGAAGTLVTLTDSISGGVVLASITSAIFLLIAAAIAKNKIPA